MLRQRLSSISLSLSSRPRAKPLARRGDWVPRLWAYRTLTLFPRYVAPERLNNEIFVEMISNTKIRLLAIDEAHCISEWGHAFRPDYLKSMNSSSVVDYRFG